MSERLELALANRILAEYGVLDAYGHVSARCRDNPERFLLSRSRAPELVVEADILEYTLASEPVEATDVKSVGERFIHGEIYRARPDVHAVVHNHSPSLIPFGVTDVPLRAMAHTSAFIGNGLPIFEIRDFEKGSDLLIRTPRLGEVLARTLGNRPAMLMRGHGAVVVARDLPTAVGRSIYLELGAHLQMQARTLAGPGGHINFLDPDEVATLVSSEDSFARAWPMWRARAMARLTASDAEAART